MILFVTGVSDVNVSPYRKKASTVLFFKPLMRRKKHSACRSPDVEITYTQFSPFQDVIVNLLNQLFVFEASAGMSTIGHFMPDINVNARGYRRKKRV
jgi:hypothetical protein